MTTLIGIMPGFEQSQVTIPSTVKAITGYSAAVVYDTTSGAIVNPDFVAGQGLVIGTGEKLLNLGSVGAFQKVGTISPGSAAGAAGRATATVTLPSMSQANGLSTLTSIQFANNSQLQTIGPKAFLGCNNLTSVALPDSCNTIGAAAFQNCTSLQSINLKGVQYIGDAAFNNAFIAKNNAIAVANPVTLNLSSAQYLGVGAFDSSSWTATGGGQAASGSGTEQPHLSKISSVTFGSKLNTLSQYAFNGANYLTSADLSSCTSLANISDNAFRNTANLTSVKFSNTIDTIGQNAFSGAPLSGSLSFNTNGNLTINPSAFSGQALTSIDFSQVKGNIVIGQSAFSGSTPNTSLTTLTLPTVNADGTIKSYVAIKDNAFQNCSALKLNWGSEGNSTIPTNIAYMGNNAFSATTLGNLTGLSYTNPLQVTSALTSYGDGQFAGIANGSKYFGPMLMSNNSSITKIDLSGSDIEALNYADMGASITPTGGGAKVPVKTGALYNASHLTDITLPASCNQFGLEYSYQSGAFANCTSLQHLNFKNFTLDTTDSKTGFAQINQQTWIQVANIMNALAYFGQQKIQAVTPSDGNNIISDQNGMNAITYSVSANPLADQGTWKKWISGTNGSSAMILKGLAEWAAPRSNFNFPISAYPAGSYGYSVGVAGEDGQVQSPVTTNVSYPAGLGTSVPAYINGSQIQGNNLSGQIEWTSNTASLQIGTSEASTGMILQNGVYNSSGAQTIDTSMSLVIPQTIMSQLPETSGSNGKFTLSENSTRPQSVWYTVSASGTISGGQSPITQTNQYDLTQDETNNIFAISPNKIAGATGNGTGGIGSSAPSGNSAATNVYTTAVGGTKSNTTNGDNTKGIAVDVPSPGSLVTNNTEGAETARTGTTISISQNYLPLGITSNVKDAYFNHNGIIWHYHNGFAAGDSNNGIYIEGFVNSYIGGQIQRQKSGAQSLSINKWTTQGNGAESNTFGNNLTNGVYNNGNDLTCVNTLNGQESYSQETVYGIDNQNVSGSSQNTVCYPYVSLFGSRVKNNSSTLVDANGENYSSTVAPKNVTVKLTLVAGSATK